MVTILLQQILDLLTGWLDSFTSWANDMGDKVAAIKTNTDNLPGIKADTADIKDNTAAVITPIGAINSNVSSIASDVGSIKIDAITIKNNAGSIATSSGTTAAFAEDIANNTLDCKNRLVTIGSDTTQIRTDSDSIAADVTEIKNTLGLYLYNTIVTEDSEGSIANFDTDLKDYLQNAVVTIPADAGGISECKIGYVDFNQLVNTLVSAYTLNNVTMSFSNDEFTVTNTSSSITTKRAYFSGTVDHVYFMHGFIKTSDANNKVRFGCYVQGSNAVIKQHETQNTSYEEFSFIVKPTTTNYIAFRFPNDSPENAVMYATKVEAVDITTLLGSDKAEELYALSDNGLAYVKAMLHKDYYPYNAGGTVVSLQSVNGSYYPNASISFGSSITEGGYLDLTTGLLAVNTIPQTLIQLIPAPIRTLKGLNSIWADCGDISVTYRESLKKYLEKQNVNSRSVNRNVNLLRENIESIEDSDRRDI